MADQLGGTIIRGADGSLYFIRDAILAEAKITEPDMQEFCEKLVSENESEVEGFAFYGGSAQVMARFEGPFQAASFEGAGSRAAGTIMCPGVMKDASFVVNPGPMTMGR